MHHPPRLVTREQMLLTLGAWAAAWATSGLLLAVAGRQLATLAPIWRALIISGVLAAVMVNLIMPMLMRLIAPRDRRRSAG